MYGESRAEMKKPKQCSSYHSSDPLDGALGSEEVSRDEVTLGWYSFAPSNIPDDPIVLAVIAC